MELRDYQIAAKAQVYEHWNTGAQNVCLQLATGGGKTAVLASIMTDYDGYSIAVAHRTELVSQLSLTLAQYGVYHNIIAPKQTIRDIVTLHSNVFGQSYYDPQAIRYVGGVKTVLNHKYMAALAPRVGLVVFDECFVAGTLIDGQPIESVQVGDRVWAFNETTGLLEKRLVMRVFKNIKPKSMVRIETRGHHVLNCTLGHPFYTKRGWIEAKDLRETDYVLHQLQKSGSTDNRSTTIWFQKARAYLLQKILRMGIPECHANRSLVSEKTTSSSGLLHVWKKFRSFRISIHAVYAYTTGVLQLRLLQNLSRSNKLSNYGRHQSQICFGKNETKQPYGETRSQKKDASNLEIDSAQTENSGRKWSGSDTGRAIFRDIGVGDGIQGTAADTYSPPTNTRIPLGLQTGFRKFISKTGNRSRWCFPLWPKAFRRKERPMLDWVRVDSVTFYESGNNGDASSSDPDNYVYNFEVDCLHTYIANGIVAHNCHHVLRTNSWGKVAALFPQARGLYPTATPQRADGKGLGRHADGIIDTLVVGVSMRDLILQGYLTQYKIIAPPNALDISRVQVTASGDYSPPQLRTAMRESRITGDVVAHYKRHAQGQLGITFAVDIESSIEIANAYRREGIPAETISSKTPALARASIMRRFRNHEILQLVNVDILGEGVDVPAVSVVSMARPTFSYNIYAQQFGRMLRPAPGKTHGILIDHVNNWTRHGLPDAPRVWTLDRRERRGRSTIAEIPLKVCLNTTCLMVYPRVLRECPHCGHYTPPAQRSTPEQVDGDLAEIDESVLAAMRGEIARIDGPVQVPSNVSTIAQLGIANRHRERREAQVILRGVIAQWAGYLHAAGKSDSEIHRTFYFRFGVDIMTAQTLGVTEANKLMHRLAIDNPSTND